MKNTTWPFVLAATAGLAAAQAAIITEISIPVGSQDAGCYPVWHGVYSVSAPIDPAVGVGNLVNPDPISAFSLHDHVYVSPYAPDPSRAIVTYQFSSPVTVSELELVQHANGITQVEGFVGNSPGSLASIGSVFGPDGDVTGYGYFAEGRNYVFDFNNTTAGTYFQFVVRKTNIDNGWANYRAYPRDENGGRFGLVEVPEPHEYTMVVVLGLLGLAVRHRRGRAKA